MKLEFEGQPVIRDPQREQVQHAVSSLVLPDRSFLILSRTPTSYIQVAIAGSDRFHIECRAEGRQSVLRARTDLSREEVARILEAYRQGGDAWRGEIEWRPIQSWKPPDVWDRVSMFFMFAGGALMVLFALAPRGFSRDTFGMDPFELFSIAFLVFLPSAIIDLRGFRTMNARDKVRTVGALVAAFLIALAWMERATSGKP